MGTLRCGLQGGKEDGTFEGLKDRWCYWTVVRVSPKRLVTSVPVCSQVMGQLQWMSYRITRS